jgi:SAM-dependent methyltransferase
VTEHEAHLAINRALWDRLADAHGRVGDWFYDVPAFLDGESALTEIVCAQMEAAVGSVEGLDLLHLQCHFGLDTLSWARLGATVTGVDFSPVAIERARELATQAGITATFVEADAQALPPALDGQFDVVFASYGALCWIADLDAWFGGAARALRTDGKLVVVECHPLLLITDSADPVVFGCPYLGGVPLVEEWEGTYAGGDVDICQPTVGYPHGLGEIVTALIRSGLRIDDFTEYLRDPKQNDPGVLTRDDTGRSRLTLGGQDLPLTYSLRATR